MNKIFAYIKEHPLPAALIGGVGLLILVLLLRRGSSGSASPVAALASYNLQEQQLQAAMATQNGQQATQYATQQLQANYANNQVNASLSAANEQTDAQLIAALAVNQTNAKANDLSAEVLNDQYHTEAQIYSQYLTDQTTLAVNQSQVAKAELPYVNKIGGSDNKLALLLSILGNGSGTNQALAVQNASNYYGAQTTNSIINGITRIGGGVLQGLGL